MSPLYVKHTWFLFMTNTPNHWAWYMYFTKCMFEACNNQGEILIRGSIQTYATYDICALYSFLLRPGLFLSHWVFVTWQGFDEATIKRVQHHIINWWTSKGECYKYYYLCCCPRKYSLVLSLWCKYFLYIKSLMRMNKTLLFPLYFVTLFSLCVLSSL